MNTKTVKLPETINESLAELVGAMFGDGHMTRSHGGYTHLISICFNSKKDIEYSEYVKRIFIKTFDITPKTYIYPNKSALVLYIHSKHLLNYFNNTLKIQLSPKNLNLIPQYIVENNNFLKSFIRGLFDTDGCVTFQNDKKYRYVLIKICTAHELFAIEVKKSLGILGINSFICVKKSKLGKKGYDVVIRNKNAVIFMDKIGSRNPRNIKKWGYRDTQKLRVWKTKSLVYLNFRDNAKSHCLP